MKAIVLVKKGIGTVVMEQNVVMGEKVYSITTNGVMIPMESAETMNTAYQNYLHNGWTVKKPKEEKKEKKVASPRAKWHFPNGEFDYSDYVETARQMGFAIWKRGDKMTEIGRAHV